jgi:hypothetical protein
MCEIKILDFYPLLIKVHILVNLMKVKHKYITRLHYKSSHGWWVRLRFANIQKAFSDSAFGSKSKSLKAAIIFRDKTLRDMAKQGILIGRKPKGHHATPTKKSKTGVVGVYFQLKKAADGGFNKYYVGSYYPKKYQGIAKVFAVNVYGEREAFRLAKAFRQEGLRSLRKDLS